MTPTKHAISMNSKRVHKLTSADPKYPASLRTRLAGSAPTTLTLVGPDSLLASPLTALYCSVRTPGSAILPTHDAVRQMRDTGVTVISGFHSPIEKECLRILLRGTQPIVVALARAIGSLRIPSECRAAFDVGRILFLSPFIETPTRTTKEAARRRNDVVAALADDAYVAHVTPGGETERVVGMMTTWGVGMDFCRDASYTVTKASVK